MGKAAIVILAITMSLLFNGCAGEKGVSPEGNKVTIRYVTFEHLPEQIVLIEQIIRDFENANPDIKVKAEFTTETRKVLTQIAGGVAPDVFYWGDWALPEFVDKGTVMDLTGLLEKNQVDLNDYFSSCVAAFKYGERIYGFPLHFSTYALVYNKDIFDGSNLPYPDENWTWGKYLEIAKVLTKDVNEDGRVEQFGTMRPPSILLIKANGGEFFNREKTECLLSTPHAYEAVQFAFDLEKKYKVTPSEGQMREMGGKKGGLPLFMSGKVGMYVTAAVMLTEFAKIKSFHWDIAPIPKWKRRVSGLSVGGLFISTQSKHPEEAFKFIKFYCGREGSCLLAKMKNCVPALKEAAETIFSSPPPRNIHIFVDALEYAEPDNPKMVNWNIFTSQIFNPEMELILLGKNSPKDGLDRIVSRTNKLLSQ